MVVLRFLDIFGLLVAYYERGPRVEGIVRGDRQRSLLVTEIALPGLLWWNTLRVEFVSMAKSKKLHDDP